MIGKQIAVGTGPGSLVSYLFGPGRHNEHEQQRLVAGSSMIEAGFSGVDLAGDPNARHALAQEFDAAWRQVRRERGLPLIPVDGETARGAARADRVFHAVLSLGEREGALPDEKWAELAREFVQQMDFTDSKNGADCAWMAVHHGSSKDGNDHLHIAVNLVRDDGRRWNDRQSKRRTAQAAARVAAKHSLEVTFDSELSSGIGNVSRPEWERARAENREPDRVIARRIVEGASLTASSEADFVRTARAAGLIVMPRRGTAVGASPTGYSVKVRDSEGGIFYSPSKWDKQLGLDKLRERYGWGLRSQVEAIDVWHERKTLPVGSAFRLPVADKIRDMRSALESERPDVHWRRAAREASTVLGAWSVQADAPQDKYLARASDALLKAAQPRRSTGREIVAGAAQTMVSVSQAASPNDTASRLALLMQMMQLVDAIARRADAERDLARAREQLAAAAVPLVAEHSILKAMHKRETAPPGWEVVNGDPVARAIRDLERAESRPVGKESAPDPQGRMDTTVPRTLRNQPQIGSGREAGPER
ncbi:relaxase/mobilization nuclease domain-containing protein [Brachybacterium sp. UNK5269]|uniref:relaxase/mobilization nuclease domain-containing protein n=1 Tax=Brachybacterium sp. UNK5269 TaxID=3408576 RepID=UPI003BAFA8E6